LSAIGVRVIDTYKDVYFQTPGGFPGGWTKFSRCANAEPALAKGEPQLVKRAEDLMRAAAYELDDSERAQGKGRRWYRARQRSHA
jgi:hypothetical protein